MKTTLCPLRLVAACAPFYAAHKNVRLLCVSDIHGHADALAAVLATAERRGFDKLLVAGDLCFPGPAPLATWQRLASVSAICVQGASDRAIATLDFEAIVPRSAHERARLQRVAEVKRELGELIVARLARLPTTLRINLEDGGELVLVHGSPVDPFEPFSHEMSDQDLRALIGDDPADVILCGGSHVPFDRTVGGVRVINVGSVGEAPGGGEVGVHGASHADATFIETSQHGVLVEQFVVPLGKAA